VQKVEQLQKEAKENQDNEKQWTEWQSQLSALDKQLQSAIVEQNEEILQLKQSTTQVELRFCI
jgi:hypothetical protein